MFILKQSTAVDVLIGPFIDDTDGKTAETALTLSQADIKLSKNGQTLAQKSDVTAAAHDANGYYNCELDATDTNTVGTIVLIVHETGALPVRHEFQVIEESIYDALYGASAAGFDSNGRVDVGEWLGTAVATPTTAGVPEVDITHLGGATQSATDLKDFADAGYDPATNKVEGVKLVDTTTTNTDMVSAPPSAASIADAVWDEVSSGHSTPGTFGQDVEDILADTGELQTDDVPGLIAALNDPTAAAITDAVWDEALSGHVGAGSFGKAVADIETDATAILADTNELQTDDVPGLIAALNDPTAAAIADQVWDEAISGHLGAGSTGEALNNASAPTAAAVADAVWDEALSGHVGAGSFGKAVADIETDATAILADTNELQTDDVPGLIAALNNVSAAEVNTQVDTALSDIGLDHLLGTAVVGADVTDNSVIAKLVSASATADWDDFVNTTDALQALRDRGDTAWTTGSGSGLTPLASGTAQGGTGTTIQLASGESFADDELNGNVVKVHTGTGAGQARLITDYTGATDTATVTPAWTTNPDATSQYEVVEGSMNVEQIERVDATDQIRDAVVDDATRIDASALNTASGAIGSDGTGLTEAGGTGDQLTALATAANLATAQADLDIITGADGVNLLSGTQASVDAIEADTNELQVDDVPGLIAALNDPTAAAVADAVWDEALSGHVGAGSYGKAVADIETDATAIVADTNELQTDDVPGLIAALNDVSTAEVNTQADTALTDFFTSKASLVDDIWDEDVDTSHQTAGTAGKKLDDAGAAADPWATALPGAYGAGTAGKIVGDNIDGKISTAQADLDTITGADGVNLLTATQASIDAIEADTNELQTDDVPTLIGALNDPTSGAIADAVWDEAMAGHVGAGTAGAQLGTDIDAILSDTNELQGDWVNGGRLDLLIDAIKAVTDALPDSGALNDLAAILTDTGTTLPATLSTIAGYLDTEIAAILADTNELQADWANGGRLDLILDAIVADTNELQTDDIPTAISSLNNPSVSDIWATALTESYSTQGSTMTGAQALYLIVQYLYDRLISGTTMTVKKLDQTTTAATLTLDDGSDPTSVARAT